MPIKQNGEKWDGWIINDDSGNTIDAIRKRYAKKTTKKSAKTLDRGKLPTLKKMK